MVYANRSRFPVFSFLDTARWAAAGTNDYVPFEISTLNYARDSRPLMRSVRGAIPLRIRLLYLFGVCRLRGPAIIIDEKNRLTVISTLGNVVGYFGDGNASGPRHEEQRTTLRAGCRETDDCPWISQIKA